MEKETNTQLPVVTFDEFEAPSYEAWKAAATEALKGGSFEKKLFTPTYEGITLQPIYTLADTEANTHAQTMPGAADYIRGTKVDGYLTTPWEIAQAIDAVDPAEFNKLAKFELEKGATTVNVTLNAASKQCVAFDAAAEGRGVVVMDAEDVKTIFDGIDLATVPVQVFAGASAVPFLGLMKEAGLTATGCIGADPIGSLVADGCLPCSLEAMYAEMATAMKEANAGLKTIYVDGNVYANGGANAIQETAYAMATAVEYIKEMMAKGFSIDEVCGQIRFGFAIGANFFMEIAKLRAAKVVWAQIVAAFGGSEESQKIDIFARTSSFTKTVYDPYANILRTTTETMSAVVGGIDALEVAPFDEAVGPADTLALRIARNIQIMFQTEFNMTATVDPAGGSYYVETLTQQVAEAVWAMTQEIAAEGGIVAAVKAGKVQAAVAEVLAARFANMQKRADVIVGNNMYANTTEEAMDKDYEGYAAMKAAVAAKGKTAIVEARAALNAGEAVAVEAIAARRLVEEFEAMRQATEAAETPVTVFLANYGPIPKHKPRAEFSTGFFEVANFKVIGNNGFATAEEAAAAAVEANADVTCICGTDDVYPEIVPVIAGAVKAANAKAMVILAGAAGENKEAFDAAGVDEYINVKANCYEVLCAIQKERGIC